MNRNLYEPPKEAVADPAIPVLQARPALVAVISFYYGFAAILSFIVLCFLSGLQDQLPAALRGYFRNADASALAIGVVGLALKSSVAIALYRQRQYAAVLLAVFCAFLVINELRRLYVRHWLIAGSPVAVGAATGSIIGILLNVGILIYVVGLRRSGVLRN